MATMTATDLPDMLRAADIQQYLDVSVNESYRLIRENSLAIDLGSRIVRVPKQRFLDWLASR